MPRPSGVVGGAAPSADGPAPPLVVVGGGLLGLYAALELTEQAPEAPVWVVDAGALGHGASWAAAGLLAPVHELEATELALTPAGFASQQLHYDWIARMGWAVGLRREGALEVALTGADLPYVQRRLALLRAHGLRVEWWGAAELHAAEPNLAPSVPGGIYTPDDAQLEPRALVHALLDTLRSRGVTLLAHTPVRAIGPAGAGLLLQLEGRTLAAQGAVLATGAAAAPPELALGWAPEAVTPVRGQMVSLSPPADGLLRRPMRLQSRTWGYGYVVPKADRLIVGSTSEEMGHDPRLTAGGLLDVLRRAHAALPGIYDLAVIETWAGLRPATAGRVPLVRRHPELPLVWANGLYRHGVLLSPLVARAAVSALRGQALPPEVAQLQP